MRLNWLKFLFLLLILTGGSTYSNSQTCRRSDINGTTIDLLCNQVCTTLVFRLPHVKQTTDYLVTSIDYRPFAYSTATGTNVATIAMTGTTLFDDRWTNKVPITFPFCYYGITYPTLLIGTNSAITFDTTLFATGSGYIINATGTIPSSSYARSMIFGPYHDIDIDQPTGLNKRIEYRIECEAPNRRFIVSYENIPLFGTSCNTNIATHQMVLYESTGIVEVYMREKPSCTGWNGGRAILGMQNQGRTAAVSAPGKNATVWNESNTAYRFTPSGGPSRFVSSQLLDMSGNLIVAADTSTTTPAMLDMTFPNVCVPPGVNQYQVVTSFTDCVDPANNYTIRDTITLSRTNSIGATYTETDATCGFTNGSITVNIPSGVGTAPFSYMLDGGTPVITPALTHTFSNLAAGPHTVVVTDASTGCTSTLDITIGLAGNLTANTSSSATACAAVNNGTITITPTLGTGPFNYVLDGGAPVSGGSPYTFTGLSPGNHTITFTDANNCTSNPIVVTVVAGPGVSATATSTSTSCPGATNGSITVNVSAGVAPYSYQLNAGTPQASNVFNGLAAGTYTITVTDNVGCTQTFTRTVANGSAVTANTAPTATSCNGAANGSVTVTPTNGTGPYTFVLDGGAQTQTGATATFNGLTSGSHTVIVTDNPSSCQSNPITFTINVGPNLTANAVPNATSCSGASNGSIVVTPTSGAAPYTFSLDGGPFLPGASPYTFNNVAAGPHTVVVRDAANCVTNTINVDVAAGPALTTTVNKTDVLCFGGTTGTITVTQPGIGTAPYEYSLDGTTWQASNIFNGLAAGTYTVYYRESNGCQGSQQITITEPTVLSATSSFVPVVCNGQSDGIITIVPAGGTSPYEYSIDGGANWQANNIFNVPAGTYTITIRDVNGCSTTQTVTVTEPAVLTASSVNTAASCDGGNDGVITVTANGGNPNYQYSIDGTNFQSGNTFNVAPGNYTVTVRDNLGCLTTFNTVVDLNNDLTFTPQTDPTICEGTSTQLELVSNATQYSWSPGTGLSSTTIHNPIANPTVTTTYIVTATLGRCSATDDVIVNVNAAPIPDAGPDGFICYGQTYQLQGNGGTQYSWAPTTYLDDPTRSNPISTPAKDITYTLSIVADANGCASLTTDDIKIDVTPPIKIRTFPFDTVAYSGDQFMALAVPSDTDATTFLWTPAIGLSDPTVANPIVTVGAIGDVAQYQVTASTIAGCKGEGYITVRVYKGPDIYVPTGFTPNGDGKNDKFIPFPVGIKSYRYFRVFNRWGQLVFATTTLNEGWDGKFKGVEQASGTYVWMIEGVTKDDRIITKKGTVTIIR